FHTLYFETTRKCNYSCEHCSSGSHLKDVAWGNELTFEQIVNRIFHPAYRLGTRNIDFSGGEFLLRKDAFELLQEADKIGFRISIVSNGATLNEKNIKKLKGLLGDNLMISLGINSIDNDENADSRCVETDKILQLIAKLEKANIRMNICVAAGAHTAEKFAITLAKIKELRLPFNRIPFTPRHSDAKHLMFNKEILKNKIHPALRKDFHGYMSYVPFFLPAEIYASETGQSKLNNEVPTNPSVGCWCGSFFSITPEGNVTPCPLLGDHIEGGNVLKEDLEQILFHSDLFRKIVSRENFGGKCGKCKYRYTCGGCRTMAYFQTGDVFGEDPTCFIEDLTDYELHEMEKETIKNFKNYVRMTNFGGLSDTKPQ
ncbi:MAG: radical SAM protein, partial [Bacteroidota bacterium]